MTQSRSQQIIDLLKKGRNLGASDVHLAVGAPAAARIDGKVVALSDEALQPDETRDMVFASLTEVQRGRLQEEWELDYAINVEDVGRFRGNIHYSRGNLEAAYRYIPNKVPDLSLLGHYPVIEEICKEVRGLILVTGVTGSGKTTTLAGMIKRIAEQNQGVIISIEDPVEFKLEHSKSLIKQRELGKDTKSFNMALRQAMRQDPDVIVVSELRDLETIKTALTAAETGHLVLAGLHTLDAPQSIDRLIDVFPPLQQQQIASQLANVLNSIVCQRLLPRANGKGRVMASEILRMNYGIRNCVRDRKVEQIPGLIEIGRGEGMHTIDDSLIGLYKRKFITLDQAIAQSRDASLFQQK